jgi:hypothetical protein
MNTLQILLSSAVIAAIVSGIISVILKRIDYKNEYHKLILHKRITAYEQIEKVMLLFGTCAFDNDKPLHGVFLQRKSIDQAMVTLALVLQYRIWINPNTYDALIELNRLIYKIQNSEDTITSAKENYKTLGDLRDKLLNGSINDYKKLYRVPEDLDKHNYRT